MRAVVAKKEQLAELRRRVAVLGGGLPPGAMQAEVSAAALRRRVRLIDGDAYGETPSDLWTRRLLVLSGRRAVYTPVIGRAGGRAPLFHPPPLFPFPLPPLLSPLFHPLTSPTLFAACAACRSLDEAAKLLYPPRPAVPPASQEMDAGFPVLDPGASGERRVNVSRQL